MFRDAYTWYANDPTVIQTKKQDEFVTFLAANGQFDVGKYGTLTELKNRRYDTFDEYKKNCDSFYTIRFCNVKKRWMKESTCSCRDFQNNFICKHLIGLAFHNKLKKCPEEGNSTMISKLPKKGRIPRAKKALQKQ